MAHEPLLQHISRVKGDLERSARTVAQWGSVDTSSRALTRHCYGYVYGDDHLPEEVAGGERYIERRDQVNH